MRKKVLGVNIDDVSEEEALEVVASWLTPVSLRGGTTKQSSTEKIAAVALSLSNGLPRNDNVPKLIFTPGPEFLVTAQKDEEFKKILNSSDLNLPDGYGLKLLGGITHQIPGVDFMLALCQKAAGQGWTVGMIGNPNTKLAAEKLKEKFPKLKIVFALDNPEADQVLMDYDILKNITSGTDGVDLLFVGVGHPKQEKFLSVIARNAMTKQSSHGTEKIAAVALSLSNGLPRNDKVLPFRVAMAVGGSFDFISGRVWEPPEIFSKLGIKWLGRLVSRPGYMVPRIYRALILFPLYLFRSRSRSK